MNVLLLNPPFLDRFSRTSRSPAVTKGGTIYYPLWLAYAAGALERAGHEVRLVDAPADCIGNDGVLARLGGFVPGLIVLDTSTPSIASDAAFAGFYKKCFPEAFTVLVGTHPSAMPEWTLGLSPAIDAVAIGEYDYTLRDLAQAIGRGGSPGSVPGLAVRDGEAVRRTGTRPLITDLDSLPFVTSVYKKHLAIRDYFFAAARYPMVMIITGRGCPHRCFFCVYPQTFHSRAYRPRSARNVADEFLYIRRELPFVREIGIEDDTFTVDRRRCAEICELLTAENVGLNWYCNARADLPYDLLVKMRRAGCRMITVGFESGSQEILDAMHKGIGIETMRRFVKDARRAGILIHGCIMAGNPGETEETIRESFRFALELDCDSMQFFPLFVYPGTEAYRWAEEDGYLTTTDFRRWLDEKGDYRCVIDLPGLPGARIAELCKDFYAQYHLRPSYILRKTLQGIRRPGEGWRTVRSAFTFFRFMLKDRRARRAASLPEGVGSREHRWNEFWSEDQQLKKFTGINTAYREVVEALIAKSSPESRCVEIGCGTGTYAIEVAAGGRNCIGTDYSPSALAIARAKAKALHGLDMKLLAADVYSPPFKEGSVDLVFSDGVLEHLDIRRAIEEMKRILKPGGWMVATVPSKSLTYKCVYYGLYAVRNRPHEAWLDMETWTRLIREAGFTEVRGEKCGSVIDGVLMRLFPRSSRRLSPPIGRAYYLLCGLKPRTGDTAVHPYPHTRGGH